MAFGNSCLRLHPLLLMLTLIIPLSLLLYGGLYVIQGNEANARSPMPAFKSVQRWLRGDWRGAPNDTDVVADETDSFEQLSMTAMAKLRRPAVFDVVHVLWFPSEPSNGWFQCRHLLSLLSAQAFLQPLTIRLHYKVPPRQAETDYAATYHQWLAEAKKQITNVEMVEHSDWVGGNNVDVMQRFVASLEHSSVVMMPSVVFHDADVVSTLTKLSADAPMCWMDPTAKLFIGDSSCKQESMHLLTACDEDRQCHPSKISDSLGYTLLSAESRPIALDLLQDVTLRDHYYASSRLSNLVRRLYHGNSAPIAKPLMSAKPVVPPLAHYIWFGHLEMRFLQMVSIRSAFTVLGMTDVIVHGDNEPTGPYWKRIKQEFKHRLHYHYWPASASAWGPPLPANNIAADTVRLMVLQRYGGLHMDFDTVGTRSLTPLLHYDSVIGVDLDAGPYGVNTAVMLAKPNSTFVNLVLDSYAKTPLPKPPFHNYFCCVLPSKTIEKHPEVVLVLENLMFQFGDDGVRKHMQGHELKEWQHRFAYHYYGHVADSVTEAMLENMNSSFGDMMKNALK